MGKLPECSLCPWIAFCVTSDNLGRSFLSLQKVADSATGAHSCSLFLQYVTRITSRRSLSLSLGCVLGLESRLWTLFDHCPVFYLTWQHTSPMGNWGETAWPRFIVLSSFKGGSASNPGISTSRTEGEQWHLGGRISNLWLLDYKSPR